MTRYRIKHSWLGWFLSIRRNNSECLKYSEKWTKDPAEAASFTLEELRAPMDANNSGLMAILVAGYTGLKLEEV
jgi:hypothetical protein